MTAAPAPRRIWSELVPHATLATPRVLGLLQRYALEPLIAVRPSDLPGLPALLAACAAEGVAVGLWPMLPDDAGRWANVNNAGPFADLVDATLGAAGAHLAVVREVALDLEPAIADVSLLLSRVRHGRHRGPPPWGAPGDFARGRARLAALADALRARGMRVSAAVVPTVLFDPPASDAAPSPRSWEVVMGTPVTGIAWDHVSAMLYSSILEGWSRGALRRRDAVALMAAACRAARTRFGPALAGASLGAVGTGALGDEPVYRDPAELAHDVAVARACGLETLTLFDLSGVLARPPCEPWLDAFTRTPPAPAVPELTLRARAALIAGALTGSTLAWLAPRATPPTSTRGTGPAGRT